MSSKPIDDTPYQFKDPVEMIDVETPEEIPLPQFKYNDNEPLATRKARLVYQSRKRGMLENDLLLSTFTAKYLKDLSEDLTKQYDILINKPTNDWDIYYWGTEIKPTPEEYDNEIMKLFKEHVKNGNREKRLRQPDLYAKY